MDLVLPTQPNPLQAAQAARCAGDQGKFWPYHDALIAHHGPLGTEVLKGTAAQLKLDTRKFDKCIVGDAHIDEIRKNIAEGMQIGVSSPPAFVINGRLAAGIQPEDIEVIIEEEVARNVKEASARQGRQGIVPAGS
jgi:protein-disulfide isomerase